MSKQKKPKKARLTHAIPLNMPLEMKDQIERMAVRAGVGEATIMRLSIERGIAAVEKMFALPETKIFPA